VLHEGAVPHDAEDEGADENRQHKDEKFPDSIRLIFGLKKVGKHLLLTDIFF